MTGFTAKPYPKEYSIKRAPRSKKEKAKDVVDIVELDEFIPKPSKEVEKGFLNVTGMTCGACAATIESYVKDLAGVESISVSVVGESAEVHFNPSITSLVCSKPRLSTHSCKECTSKRNYRTWFPIKRNCGILRGRNHAKNRWDDLWFMCHFN